MLSPEAEPWPGDRHAVCKLLFVRKRMSSVALISISESFHVNRQTLPRMRPQARPTFSSARNAASGFAALPAWPTTLPGTCVLARNRDQVRCNPPVTNGSPASGTNAQAEIELNGLISESRAPQAQPAVRNVFAGQERFQAVQTHRLGEVSVEAGFLGPVSILFLSISGQRDQKAVSEAGILAKVAGQLETAHPRHTDVAYHDFGQLQPGQGQRRRAVVRGSDLMAGESEQDRHAVGRIPVVIDEQDSSRRCTLTADQGRSCGAG